MSLAALFWPLRGGVEMSDEEQRAAVTEEVLDDSLAYEKAQQAKQEDNPLSAITAMRLEQLAVCRLRSKEEMQAMQDQLQSTKAVEDSHE